jgi:hypothetical protein
VKASKSYLLWAAYPFALLLGIFGFIGVVNWSYERKLLALNNDSGDWASAHMGPILLATAIGLAAIASLLLFLIRVFWPRSQTNWFMVPLTFITIILVFPSVFIIILGPAAITMVEQTQSAGPK